MQNDSKLLNYSMTSGVFRLSHACCSDIRYHDPAWEVPAVMFDATSGYFGIDSWCSWFTRRSGGEMLDLDDAVRCGTNGWGARSEVRLHAACSQSEEARSFHRSIDSGVAIRGHVVH